MRSFLSVLAATLAVSACGGDAAPSHAEQPRIEAAPLPADDCGWIPASEVEAILGPLAEAPESTRQGCVYRLAQPVGLGTAAVTLEVVPGTGVGPELAAAQMDEHFARQLGAAGKGATPDSADAPAGWDYARWITPLEFWARVGHVAVRIARGSIEVPGDLVETLAARVHRGLPDRPFEFAPDPVAAELARITGLDEVKDGGGSRRPDPCALLARAEAEAVLGPLTVPPYRTDVTAAANHPDGDACAYYTGSHRVLVIRPVWSHAQTEFQIARNLSGLQLAALTGGGVADTLEGSWDDAVELAATGQLLFLKGDRMLEVSYRTSPADAAGAVRLARLAVERL